MEKVQVLMVLGARIGIDSRGQIALASHTEMRAESAKIFYHDQVGTHLLVCGGYCFGVRYPLRLSEPLIQPPDFSEEARKKALLFPSESAIISWWLNQWGVPYEKMLLEQFSRNTAENARLSARIVKNQFGARCQAGVLSMLYHLLRPKGGALTIFREAFAEEGLPLPLPVFTEEVLSARYPLRISDFYEYYRTRRGAVQWPADEIRLRLMEGKGLAGLKPVS